MRPVVFALLSFTLIAQDLTLEKQQKLGAAIATEIEAKTTPIVSRYVQDYVDQLGAKIAAQINAPFPFSFLAVNEKLSDEMHEPLAVPGGHIFVSAALILASKNESEFAGMLAQAMARRPLRARANGGTIPLIFIGGVGTNAMIPTGALPELRQINLDADRAAVTALARAGFDPSGLLNYVDREQRDQRFSAFPDRATRIAALKAAIGKLPPATYTESGDFARVQDESRPAPEKPPTLRWR